MSQFLPFTLEDLVQRGAAERIVPTTDSGWTTYGPGGRLFLPAATNYHQNPSFETDSDSNGTADGCSTSSSGFNGTSILSTVPGRTGGLAQRIQIYGQTGSAAYVEFGVGNTPSGEFPSGTTCTVSTYLRTLGGTPHAIQLHITNDANSYWNAGVTPPASWTRYSGTFTTAENGSTLLRFKLIWNWAIHEGDYIDIAIDDVLIEKSAVLTPYFDGTYPSCAWTGTADASTSTRPASTLIFSPTAPWQPSSQGTVAVCWSPLWGRSELSSAAWGVLGLSSTGALVFGFVCTAVNGSRFNVRETSSVYCDASAVSWVSGSRNTSVGRWYGSAGGGGTVDNNLNGTNATQANLGTQVPPAVATISISGTPSIAPYGSTRSQQGSIIVSPVRKSDAWVAAIQANSGAAFSNPVRLWRDFMAPGDIIFPLGMNSVGYLKTNRSM